LIYSALDALFQPKGKRRVAIRVSPCLNYEIAYEEFCLAAVTCFEPRDKSCKDHLVLGLHNDSLNIAKRTFKISLFDNDEEVRLSSVWVGDHDPILISVDDYDIEVDSAVDDFAIKVNSLSFKMMQSSVEEDDAAVTQWLADQRTVFRQRIKKLRHSGKELTDPEKLFIAMYEDERPAEEQRKEQMQLLKEEAWEW